MIGNMSAVEMARQRAEGAQAGGGGNAQFFSLQEGESTILRFLTGMVPTYIVSHQCGLSMVDIKKDVFEECRSAGVPVRCPGCGQPLSESDIVGERGEVLGAEVHNFFPTNEADKRTSFTCIGSKSNASFGYVPNVNGVPMYQCPACASQHNLNKQTGKPRTPAFRLYGVAVERQARMETQMVNGIPTPVIKDIQDVVVEADGIQQPKVVIVNMSWTNFWSKLAAFSPDYSQSICNYDWRVTRIGNGLNTTYDCVKVSDMPTSYDLAAYAAYMPDVKGIISNMGQPDYYEKKGYHVPGYTPPEQEQAHNAAGVAQAAVMQAVQQYSMPAAQPAPPMQTGADNDWSVIQNQFTVR